jgi:protein-S-isoprenylcysteine O-methyltransferase Ste14/predicted DCC family thiol-disulfide oxidoreductase YuxK
MLGTLTFREARPASTAWNVAKTLLLTVPFWAVFYVALPALFYLAEGWLGLDGFRFGDVIWQAVGVTLFILGSLLHLVSNFVMAVRGEGTPMTLDCPRQLVIAGPYRFVRNPMSLASLVQSVGVGLFLGSPAVLLLAVLLALIDDVLLRPAEEADLERRFGEAYRRYRRRVRCWRPRLRPYDPTREAEEPPLAAERTTPPGRYVVLFDGHCKFCTLGAKQLAGLGKPGAVELVSFQEPGVLDQFPGLSHEACMRQMYLVVPDGRVFGGFEAAVRAVATRPVVGWIALGYYLPGVRWVFDTVYALVAANRYRIMGKTLAQGGCQEGTCSLHVPKKGGSAAR